MPAWLALAIAALLVWSVQRAISKAVLATLTTPQFYLLSAVVALPVYLPVLILAPPPLEAFPAALGLSAMIAVTFGLTTEAIRRGPIGRVSPITGLSPALTAILAFAVLGERPAPTRVVGIALAVAAVMLLGYQRRSGTSTEPKPWLMFALASFALQGVGAFLAKVVVTSSGPSALLVTSAVVQVLVGMAIARRARDPFPALTGRLMRWTVFVLALAALATIGYLWSLSRGPASVVVPLVAMSPALGGLIGAVALHEHPTRAQYWGMATAVAGAAFLTYPAS
jgi:O-acetylserine/cysteine efflux transporter